MYESMKPKPALTCEPRINSAHWHTRPFVSPSGSDALWPTSPCWHLPRLLGHAWAPGCPGHGHTSLPNHGRREKDADRTYTKKGISWTRVSFLGLAANSGTIWMTLFMTLRR